MDIHEWVKYGFDKGFCGEVVCVTHDGLPYSDLEWADADDGGEMCCYAVRVYDNTDGLERLDLIAKELGLR